MALGYDEIAAIWPDFPARGIAAPVRVGVDNRTGKMLVGFAHVQQSIHRLFVTQYHQRILRRWVGCFVPHLLGELATAEHITRFFGAIMTAVDLWEPCFSCQQVVLVNADGTLQTRSVRIEKLRMGELGFRLEGIYMPRGHLGDRTPESRRSVTLIGDGTGAWERLEP